MLNKYGEKTQPCQTPFLTGNYTNSVPATLLSELFLVQFGQQVKVASEGQTILDFTEAETMGWHWHQLDHMQVICTSL